MRDFLNSFPGLPPATSTCTSARAGHASRVTGAMTSIMTRGMAVRVTVRVAITMTVTMCDATFDSLCHFLPEGAPRCLHIIPDVLERGRDSGSEVLHITPEVLPET